MDGNPTKKQSLNRIDAEFLREIAFELNGDYFGSYREYSECSKEEMVDLLTGKLTVNEVEKVVTRYLLCHTASDIANSITPAETHDIKNQVEEHFGKNGVHEVKVRRRFCDLVFPDELIAVEVKSARDKIEKAVQQSHDYSKWADRVFLAYDVANEHLIPDELWENGVGLLRYENESIILKKEASTNESPKEELLSSMTYDHLRKICREHDVSMTGKKEEMVERLSSNLSRYEVRYEFSGYVRKRGIKYTKQDQSFLS